MGLRFDDLGDFRQLEGHDLCVAAGQDEASGLALLGANGAEDVGRLGALIMGCAGASGGTLRNRSEVLGVEVGQEPVEGLRLLDVH